MGKLCGRNGILLQVWDGDGGHISKVMEELSNGKNCIPFKEEIGNSEINYLDINVKINRIRKTEFDIFRKKYLEAIIRCESFHPINYKMAAINTSMCKRA